MRIQNNGQVHKLGLEPDVSDVGHPELVGAPRLHLCRQIRIHRPAMVRIGGHDKLSPAQAQQVVFAHDPVDPLVVGLPAAPFQFRRDPPATVGRPLERDLLDRIPQFHVLVRYFRTAAVPVEARPADYG
jgi:hypothetical protein